MGYIHSACNIVWSDGVTHRCLITFLAAGRKLHNTGELNLLGLSFNRKLSFNNELDLLRHLKMCVTVSFFFLSAMSNGRIACVGNCFNTSECCYSEGRLTAFRRPRKVSENVALYVANVIAMSPL